MDKEGSRFKLWGLLAVASAVSIGAVVTSSPKPRGHDVKYVIACISISLIISVIYAATIKFWKSNQEDILKKVEGGITFVLFIFWAAAIAVLNDLNSINTAGALFVVANANVYYFTWACFFIVLALLGNSMQGIAVAEEVHTSRTAKWVLLTATSLIMMAASVSIFRASKCAGKASDFCVATRLGLGLGCCCGFVCLVLICMVGKAGGDNPDKFIQIETIMGATVAILFAIAVGFVTGPGGPGATIGNLYYSTWLSFFLSIAVTLDCVSVVTKDMKLPSSITEVANTGAPSSNEMPTATTGTAPMNKVPEAAFAEASAPTKD